jgi:8-oxo-dGTP diphosphatase
MTKYVLGFIFDSSAERVLLIEKQRPAWQAGKLNGIGGKIEAREKAVNAMVREAFEECHLFSRVGDWLPVATLKHREWSIEVFTTVHTQNPHMLQTKTDEFVSWHHIKELPSNALTNLSWLIPLSKDVLQNREVKQVVVRYT